MLNNVESKLIIDLSQEYPDKKVDNLLNKNRQLYQKLYFNARKKGKKLNDYLNELGFNCSYNSSYEKTDERIRGRLEKLYPNKVVVGLRKYHNSLAQIIFAVAKKRGMNQNQYLDKLGFSFVDSRKVEIEVFKSKLTEIFPDKIISNISRTRLGLYQRIGGMAKKANMSIEEFVSSMGFKYVDCREKEELKNIKEQLAKFYPDGNVVSVFRKHHSLYRKTFLLAKQEGLTVHQYLEKLGFNYVTSKNKEHMAIEEEIKKELLTKYPCRSFDGLSKKDRSLYYKVKRLAIKKNQTVKELLSDLGFTFLKSKKQ